MLMSLGQSPHLENHYPKQNNFSSGIQNDTNYVPSLGEL